MTAREVRPPDLEMQVRIAYEQGRTRLIYTLHSPTGAVAFAHRVVAGPAFEGSPEQFQRHLLRKIEQLGDRRDIDGGLLLRDDIERKLVNLGRELWRELIPLEIRNAYRQIRRDVRSWLIVSDEPWIPWELIKPFEAGQPDDLVDDDFLSLSFELTRWLAGDRTPAQRIAVRRFAVLPTAADLPHAEEECEVLLEIARSSPRVEDATPRRLSAADLVAFLETRDVELLHFTGHGTHAMDHPEESGVPFPDGSVLRPEDLEGPSAARIARNQPLVFLNACWAGQQGWTLTRLGGWAARWVQVCGCGAFLAPLWPARDKTALAFARAFYEALSQGATLGEAALQARRQAARQRRGDPSALAYTVYGHPNARLVFGEASVASEARPEKVVHGARLTTEPPRREPAAIVVWLRRQWRWPRARRRWIAAALWSALVALLATGDRWGAVAGWLEERPRDASRDAGLAASPAAPPAASLRGEQNERPTGGGRSASVPPSAATTASSAHGIQLEVTAGSSALRSVLIHALKDAAAPLAEVGITGWVLRVDLEAPRMSTFTQDGLPWESCRLLAYCRARRDRRSLHLGPVSAVNSQTDGTIACEEAAGDLAKSVVQRLVTTLRKEDT